VTLAVGASGTSAALSDTLFPATSVRADLAQDLSSGQNRLIRLRTVHPVSAVFVGWYCVAFRAQGTALWPWEFCYCLRYRLRSGWADVALLALLWLQITHLLGAYLLWIALVLQAARVSVVAAWRADDNSGIAMKLAHKS
jgi:heme a synthase